MNQLKFFKFALLITIATINYGFSQDNRSNKDNNTSATRYTYYIDVVGVDSKLTCKSIENRISEKQGVVSFKTVGFPSKYFVLKASKAISQSDLKSWLQESNLQLTYFGQEESSLESLIKNKRTNN